MQEYFEAGKIASEAREYGISLLKQGVLIKEVVDKIEEYIKQRGAKMAFPVNLSINNFAAHDTADINDRRVIKKGDLVKIDVGVHINGFIADTAKTKEVDTNKYKQMIKASEKALEDAISLAKPGTELWEIGYAIETKMKEYGFNPIRNLSGHGLKRYALHSGTNIPNYNNNDKTKLKQGEVIAIEPFATNGVGLIVDKGEPKIFGLKKPSRVSRKSWNRMKEKFGSLPFSKTWLEKKELFYLKSMVKEGSIRAYYPLKEKSNGLVTQTEHTVIVSSKPIVITK